MVSTIAAKRPQARGTWKGAPQVAQSILLLPPSRLCGRLLNFPVPVLLGSHSPHRTPTAGMDSSVYELTFPERELAVMNVCVTATGTECPQTVALQTDVHELGCKVAGLVTETETLKRKLHQTPVT